MTDKANTDESLESRVEQLEDQIGGVTFQDVQRHIDEIENKQDELQHDLEVIIEEARRESENIPHIESVKGLYNRLENLEQDLSNLRKSVGEVANQENDT